MLYVVKDNKTIFGDKTLVGTIGYATPMFTSPMTTIVFNPGLDRARDGGEGEHLAAVAEQGTIRSSRPTSSPSAITASRWTRPRSIGTGSIRSAYTFSQKAGPHNNLGKVKFLYPNRHTVYMHDTLPVRKKYFKQSVRMIGHECVRMEKPDRFAEVLLAESQWVAAGPGEGTVGQGRQQSRSRSRRKFPVHMVYFTAVVEDSGKVETFADVYGLDRKLAARCSAMPPDFRSRRRSRKAPTPGEADARRRSTAHGPQRHHAGDAGLSRRVNRCED